MAGWARQTPSILVFYVFVAGCADQTPSLSVPTLEHPIPPRQDGVYIAKAAGPKGADLGWDFLRFLPNRHVAGLSSGAPIDRAVRLLFYDPDRPSTGTYTTVEGQIRFILRSKLGTVAYRGVVDKDHLTVRWHSNINGASEEQTYTFVPVQVDDEPTEADAGASAPSEAPAAEDAVPPIDMALLPPGSGWFCFHADAVAGSPCSRSMADCEASRKTTAAASETGKATRCAAAKRAFCYTIRLKTSGEGKATCFASADECRATNGQLHAATNASDYVVSGCEEE
jgi:hypothetical protein